MKIKTLICGLLLLTGCAVRPNPEGWTEKTVETKYLSFQVWEKEITPGEPLRIYIEGDGDPTPRRPIALELAERDPNRNVIYVSRPCQYVWCDECKNAALWREERFHNEILMEMKELILYLGQKYQTPSIDLIGYDGGGTIALLLATKLPVNRVVTVGGIIDTQNYAAEHNIKINGQNPMTMPERLAQVAQVHYIGEKDTEVSRRMTERFVARLTDPKSVVVKIVPDATHTNWNNLVIE